MHGELNKLVRAFHALYLNRPGYWACTECTAHNNNTFLTCQVCKAKCWKRKMPTELLSLGPVSAIIQNTIYALPASRCLLFCQTGAATFEQSNAVAFTTAVAVTLDANKQAELAGGFLRCTSGNVSITLKKA